MKSSVAVQVRMTAIEELDAVFCGKREREGGMGVCSSIVIVRA